MKILYILSNLNRSAPNTIIVNIIKNLKDAEAFILSLNKSQDDNYKKLLEEMGIRYLEYPSFIKAFFDIKNIIKHFKDFDILHLNGYHPNIFGYMLKKLNKRYTLISTCHSVEDQEAKSHDYKGLNYYKTKLRLFLQKTFYPKHDIVVAVSKQVKKYLNDLGCKNALTIYNGVDYDRFPPRIPIQSSKEFLDLCQIGHVMNLKNHMYSVRLIQFLKERKLNVRLHIFGSCTFEKHYFEQVKEYIVKHKLSNNVVFYGSLQFEQLFDKLAGMDIYLMPSLSEGLPLALLEAMYFELPAIVSSNGGMKEIVKDYENGLIVDINDEREFAKIYNYIQSKQYISDGIRARKMALEKFDAKTMANEYSKQYMRLIS